MSKSGSTGLHVLAPIFSPAAISLDSKKLTANSGSGIPMYLVVQMIGKASVRWSALAVLVSLLGCGGGESTGPQRFSLSGTVTYGDAPVPQAELFFAPNDEKGNEGPGGIAIAQDGKYVLDADKGIVGGAYKVTITSQSPVPLKEGESFTPQFPTHEFEVDLPEQSGTHDFAIPVAK